MNKIDLEVSQNRFGLGNLADCYGDIDSENLCNILASTCRHLMTTYLGRQWHLANELKLNPRMI